MVACNVKDSAESLTLQAAIRRIFDITGGCMQADARMAQVLGEERRVMQVLEREAPHMVPRPPEL